MTQLTRTLGVLMFTLATPVLISASALAAPAPESALSYRQMIPESDAVQKLSSWPAGPRLAGNEMIAKYGAPNEITDERMIWHDADPFKRILLTREGLPHHFPIVHMDYLQHTISYDVPPDKAGDVLAFDGSITIYRVGGELSARCDLESNNVLTLNLAHDIIEGKKTVEQAREAFGAAVIARTTSESPAITADLQFDPQAPMVAADTDIVSIAGTPMPAASNDESTSADSETLALLVASDLDKVHAAMIAKNKMLAAPIMDFARLMHQTHGNHLRATVDVGTNSHVIPVMTESVSALKEKHAGMLAEIVLLDGDAFERAYLDLAIEAQSDTQRMIDERLEVTNNEEVRQHLIDTRKTVLAHIERARELKSEVSRTASR